MLGVEQPETMTQEAPYPQILADLVAKSSYRPKWLIALEDRDRGQGSKGLTLAIYTVGFDSYHVDRGENYRVVHYFPVPPAAYNEESWKRWLLDRLVEVETHEACEFLVIDGERPFAPQHGPGNDPYIVFQHGSDLERRTRYTGEVKPAE